VCDPVPCGPAWAALATPPPVATPAISVITPTAIAILVVQRIRIRVPSLQRTVSPRFPALGLPPEAVTRAILARIWTKSPKARRYAAVT
jgi:hypothetical protein